MKSIDLLEHGGGFFHIRHHGELIAMPDPREIHYQLVLASLEQGILPGLPEDIPAWQVPTVVTRWAAAWDLPAFPDARRLAYLVDHYRGAISHDLTLRSLDLGELWRARRWTLLLDIIDRLPSHSWYASSVSMDEEHAKMLAEAMAARARDGSDEGAESKGPPLTSWTPEVAMLTNIFDAVRSVQYAVVAVQAEKGKAPEPPKPAPRPVTPLERYMQRAEYTRRKTKHESLVARVLPQKRKPS